nr:PREDICTED: probable LRR receptor-like serine/threonine-protein kinase At1g56140 [Musa acuminata subsp. malaccensis]
MLRHKRHADSYWETLVLCFLCLLFFLDRFEGATTVPAEVAALNAILGRWGWTASATSSPAWNISGEPCSGAAIGSTALDDPNFNPGIKCDCSYDNGTTCHITRLILRYRLMVADAMKTFRDLNQNYLTGPLPAFIGNLTKLQYLTFGANALSGSIPKELGKLTSLISLSLGINNFTGPIPLELGNLTNLQQLYINSCGASGEFPSTISGLSSLQKLWASDNNFTGKFPDFSRTSLATFCCCPCYHYHWLILSKHLQHHHHLHQRIQGNSFEGPIPSSLSNMTKVTDLRIGDIQNGSSSLAFIHNLSSLSILILRNCRISDIMPSDFSRFTSLRRLDLSFNNLTGQIPQSLFNLSLLSYLFLGNNSLSGSLPTSKSESLLNIDLSYNQLGGSFPSWVSEQNLKINLVANNFVISGSNNSVLASGLNCLQRDIPCNHRVPIYSSFAINCGGNKTITSSDGTLYEIDGRTLSSASYYVTETNKWAVSTVGSFQDASNAEYTLYSSSQFQKTQEPELYQTARISPSSLRYYGLGLENGNYTVMLHFAETQIFDPPTWRSTGRRIFDIYIQGNRVLKDFDIRAEENSFTAVTRKFIVPVTDNFLEIHFFWAGKGTCCVPDQGYYGPSVSAISVNPYDFIPTVSNEPPSSASKNSNKSTIVGIFSGIGALVLLIVFGILIYWQRQRLSKDDEDELLEMSSRPDTFSYAELRSATEDFDPSNKLGEGGFGPVFKKDQRSCLNVFI